MDSFAAHIYPYSLGGRGDSQELKRFWLTLEDYWDIEKVKAWRDCVVGPDTTETADNLLAFAAHVHSLWGDARFALKPFKMNPEKTELIVQFYWLPSTEYSQQQPLFPVPTIENNLRQSPKNAKLWDCETEHIISSGHQVVFKTANPDTHPLPSMDSLQMQWNLIRLQALSGAADADDLIVHTDPGSEDEGAAYMAAENESTDSNHEEEDDDDEDEEDGNDDAPSRQAVHPARAVRSENVPPRHGLDKHIELPVRTFRERSPNHRS